MVGTRSVRLVRLTDALVQEGRVAQSFKMIGQTAKSGPSLCLSCKYGKVVRGQNCEEIIFCSSYEVFGGDRTMPVPFRVADCGGYASANTPDLDEMKSIAWEVTARKRGSVGFEGGITDPNEMVTEITPPKKKYEGSVTDL